MDINDYFRHTCFLLYADDLKIYREILSLDDCHKLQADLNHLTSYCRVNRLHLSLAKCKSITFTKKTYNRLHVLSRRHTSCKGITDKRSRNHYGLKAAL